MMAPHLLCYASNMHNQLLQRLLLPCNSLLTLTQCCPLLVVLADI
jgi:hypothetical protein